MHEEVRAKMLQRDKIFQEWASSLNSWSSSSSSSAEAATASVEYVVISDCHSLGYLPWSLDKAFQTDSVLAQLVASYVTVGPLERRKRGGRKRKREEESKDLGRPAAAVSSSEVMLELWLNFMKREEENNSFTCIAWVKGFCPSSSSSSPVANPAAKGCLISHSSPSGCRLSTSALAEPVALI